MTTVLVSGTVQPRCRALARTDARDVLLAAFFLKDTHWSGKAAVVEEVMKNRTVEARSSAKLSNQPEL